MANEVVLDRLDALLLTCCIAWADDQPESPPMEVSYCQLAIDPSAWTGKRIRVRAIYHYGFEFYRLESPHCCQERATKIWVQTDALDGRSERLFRKLDKGMGWALVVFVGRFDVGNVPWERDTVLLSIRL